MTNKNTTTIPLSKETKLKLIKLIGEFQQEKGIRYTYDRVISELVNLCEKEEKVKSLDK